jgi:hypothetical protein
MPDESRRKAERTASELAETESAFAEVRAALVGRLFASPMDASAERERLYLAVQVLDSVRARMKAVVAGHSDDKTIAEFVAHMRSA